MTIAREGWVFVGTLLGVGLLLALFRLPWFAGVVLALGLFTAFFFRDPERTVPSDPRLVLSPGGRQGDPGGAGAGRPSVRSRHDAGVDLPVRLRRAHQPLADRRHA